MLQKKSHINLNLLKKMFENGATLIEQNYEHINDLNVFPVPDGDTGTNMKITVISAIKETNFDNINSITELSKIFSRSLLMNARGNSGVILSQILKGFMSGFKDNVKELSPKEIKNAFISAKSAAYLSVSSPVEGTILTVIRIIAESLEKQTFNNHNDLFEFVLKIGEEALALTTSLLPALAQVGVVDSGGYGLVRFIEGMKLAVNDQLIKAKKEVQELKSYHIVKENFDEDGFGYCSEIILKIGSKIEPSDSEKRKFNLNKFKSELLKFGDSLVCVKDEEIVKVHIHTKIPSLLLNLGQKYGEFIKVKIENMTEQFYERLNRDGINISNENKFVDSESKKKLSDKIEIALTVSSKKIYNIFKNEYGLKYLLNTNTKGNSSIQEIIEIIDKTNSSRVIFITDDTNIVLAAKQAANVLNKKVDVRVIGAGNTIESLMVALEFDPICSLDLNEKNMNKTLKESLTCLVSKSVKDVEYPHISLNKDDAIGIINKKIISANVDEFIAVTKTIDLLMKKTDSPDVALIFYGKNCNQDNLEKIEQYMSLTYDIVCDIKDGGQEVFTYCIGIQ